MGTIGRWSPRFNEPTSVSSEVVRLADVGARLVIVSTNPLQYHTKWSFKVWRSDSLSSFNEPTSVSSKVVRRATTERCRCSCFNEPTSVSSEVVRNCATPFIALVFQRTHFSVIRSGCAYFALVMIFRCFNESTSVSSEVVNTIDMLLVAPLLQRTRSGTILKWCRAYTTNDWIVCFNKPVQELS